MSRAEPNGPGPQRRPGQPGRPGPPGPPGRRARAARNAGWRHGWSGQSLPWSAVTLVALTLVARLSPPARHTLVVASIPFWSMQDDTSAVLANRQDVNEVSPWIYGLSRSGAIETQYPQNLTADVAAASAKLRAAHLRLVPSIANVTGGKWDYPAVARVLHNPALCQSADRRDHGLVQRQGYAGIDIDYEELHPADRQAFTHFVSQLADALHARGKVLSVAVFAQLAGQSSNAEHCPGLRRPGQGRRSGPRHGLQLPLGELSSGRDGADQLGQVGASGTPPARCRPARSCSASRCTDTTGRMARPGADGELAAGSAAVPPACRASQLQQDQPGPVFQLRRGAASAYRVVRERRKLQVQVRGRARGRACRRLPVDVRIRGSRHLAGAPRRAARLRCRS